MALWPITLPILFLLPYAFFVERFRVLIWVWQSAYAPFWITLSLVCFLALLSSVLIYRLYRGALVAYGIGVLLSLGQPSYLAMREHRHFLLVLLFILLCAQVWIFEHLRALLALPFYSSRRRWWESYPKAIPHLHASLSFESEKIAPIEVRLSNLGRTGCFVFSTDRVIASAPKQVSIKQGDSTLLERPVERTVSTSDGFGMGLRFVADESGADWGKDLEDYLVHLRRSGYVEA